MLPNPPQCAMADVLVLVAHPDIARSRVNRALAAQARLLPTDAVEVRDLYALYPDFVIDVDAEQAALAIARAPWSVLHPVQWYSMPALMKLWVDDVLEFRWAYGPGGARAGKGKCLWLVVSAGGGETSYQRGRQQPPSRSSSFLPAYRQTAELVGMQLPRAAGVLHGAHKAEAHARCTPTRTPSRSACSRLRGTSRAPDGVAALPAVGRRRTPDRHRRLRPAHYDRTATGLTLALTYLAAAVIFGAAGAPPRDWARSSATSAPASRSDPGACDS